jgi:hypothetical protein
MTNVNPRDPSTDPDTKYRFFPVVRRGYPPDTSYDAESVEGADELETKGTLQVDFEAVGIDGSDRKPSESSVDIQLYGPAHVTGLDHQQVVRMEPEPDTSNYPPNYFATVEFDAPDLPWLFSPVSDDTVGNGSNPSTGKGFPWCCLIVAEKTEETRIEPAGSDKPLPSVKVPPVELPPLDEAWAWAHAQVVGDPQTKEGVDSLDDAFRSKSKLTRSRLVSPRNLQGNTKYVAAVVPTFEAGVRAGLGKPAKSNGGSNQNDGNGDSEDDTETAALAWKVSETNVGDDSVEEPIELPMYHHWEFSTGEKGDFEYLARQLESRNLNADEYDIGFQEIDVSDPGPASLEVWGTDADGETDNRTVRMGGALRKDGSEPITADDYTRREELRELLNDPGTIDEWADEDYEAVGPPIYGNRHAQVETLPESIDADQRWLWDLNLSPGNRMAAAVGASIVRDNQEQLMDQAWEQVGEIRAANRRLAAGQLSREAMESVLESVDDAPTGWQATFTAPMHDRTLRDGETVGAHLDDSSLPRGLTSAPFRRLTSGSGRLSKRLETDVDVGDVIERVASGDLDVATPSSGPDGMGTAAEEADLAEICDTLPSGPEEVSGEPDEEPERPEMVQTLLVHLDGLENQCDLLLELLADLGMAMTKLDREEWTEDDSPIPTLVDRIEAEWLALQPTIDRLGNAMIQVATAEQRDDLPGVSEEFTEQRARSLHERASAVAGRDLFGTRYLTGMESPLSSGNVSEARSVVIELLNVLADIKQYLKGGGGSDEAYLEGLVCDSVPEQVSPVDPDLDAATELNPVDSLIDRFESRLGGLDLDAPHRSDPLDRVMAYPEFPKPTYDDLKEVSEDYLLPGVNEVPKNTVGALVTNPQFIESFMVGLNHEMASELLWRRYPTDRRGSYFRQFWDPSARVPKPDDDELLKDITEIHTWDDKGPNNVARSELGSNIMTGAGGGGNEAAGEGSEPNSQVVIVIRGELLRRYPTTTVYLAKARKADQQDESPQARVPKWPEPTTKDEAIDTPFHRFQIFRGRLDPDVTFLGFDLTPDEATGETPMESVGDPSDDWVDENGEDDLGWYLVLEEPPGEVRFGLDANQGDAGKTPPGITDKTGTTHTTSNPDENPEHGWSALSWGHLVENQSELETKQNVSVYRDRPGQQEWRTKEGEVWETENDSELEKEDEGSWGKNSAHMAYITWQRPVRIAIHADDLLPGGTGSETEET